LEKKISGSDKVEEEASSVKVKGETNKEAEEFFKEASSGTSSTESIIGATLIGSSGLLAALYFCQKKQTQAKKSTQTQQKPPIKQSQSSIKGKEKKTEETTEKIPNATEKAFEEVETLIQIKLSKDT